MLDQMFTAENFRRIYDAENRKGLDLEARYFPTLKPHTLAVREKLKDIMGLYYTGRFNEEYTAQAITARLSYRF
jgi:hypothetical protein